MYTVEEFGAVLARTGDLDPIYLMLRGAELPAGHRARWCLAYWMFYHAGVASALSECAGARFWDRARAHLSGSHQFPRGTERRHFRGSLAVAAVTDLAARFPFPETVTTTLAQSAPQFTEVARAVREWSGFGPWIAFKVADMLDAVLGVPVNFADAVPEHIFDDPMTGAVWAFHLDAVAASTHVGNEWEGFRTVLRDDGLLGTDAEIRDRLTQYHDACSLPERRALTERVFRGLQKRMQGIGVPHAPPGTSFRIQEIETVLCKWKAHVTGHYPVGKDTTEILHALKGWGPTAARCRDVLIERQLQNYDA